MAYQAGPFKFFAHMHSPPYRIAHVLIAIISATQIGLFIAEAEQYSNCFARNKGCPCALAERNCP